ncbi:YcaO-like family protein [Streptomyces sp. NPDC016845]|uniref:YcaO-like family protein n=1 Tax=Streptomyces sp. NPDC016845 TaxID=3364972 RepID=UPI003797C801
MDAQIESQHELRADVRLVPRDDRLYVCASTETLRVPLRLPPPTDMDDRTTVRLDSVPEQVTLALHERGMAHGSGREAHPLYGELAALRDHEVALVAPQALGPELGAQLALAGVRAVPEGQERAAAVTVVSLALPEEHLMSRVRAGLETGTPMVTYLSTPTRLFYATLAPPHTACAVCVVRRLRANHTWQAIADLPLDVLFGAAHDPAWPSAPVTVGLLAHAVLTLLAGSAAPAQGTGTLTEVAHGSLERTGHPLLHLPNCPACGHVVPLPERPEEPARADDTAGWERMRGAVDPLTGLVPQLRVEERDSALGGATYARTAGMTKTRWFSPVSAEARGGAVKSDPVTARVCAVGETMERYAAGVYDPAKLLRASFAALGEDAVDPRTLPLGSPAEYARLDRLAPCDPDAEIDWIPGRSLSTGAIRYVPACAVYLPYRFPPGHRAWYDPISTGLAAGGSYHHAVYGGLMEAVERDATVLFWANRLTLPTLDLDALPEGPARDLVVRVRAQGVSVMAKDLTTDLGIPAVGVRFLRHTGRRPVTTHAARADLDPQAALLGALEEGCLGWAGARLWQEHLDDGEGIPGPDDVLTTLKQFSLYYWAPDRVRHLAFWDEGPVRAAAAARPGAGFPADVAEGIQRLARRGYEAVAVDITPVDVAECGVTVVRTVVPGLCPITLRSDFHRRGGPRVFEAPVAMGARSIPLSEEELNPLPLPFM